MTFIIVCGGTAGHVNPGISIAGELKKRIPECKILFIGADRELEKRLVPKAGFELVNIKMTGIRRGFRPRDISYNIKTLFNIIGARREAGRIIKETKPCAVIGTGGYICYPVIKEAARRKIPTFIHESNAIPGMTVKKLSAIADKVMVTYNSYHNLYKRPERIIVTGTPVRREFFEDDGTKNTDKPLVVSFWGSLGAEGLNRMMAEFIKRNSEENSFRHIHATGSAKSTSELKENLLSMGLLVENSPYTDIRDYIDDVPSVLKSADLVICRAGGITLSEIASAAVASILLPSPFVPDNVQQYNAKEFSSIGAAKVLNEAECDGGILFNEAAALIRDREKRLEMAAQARTLARPGAVSQIADIILGSIGSQAR